MGRVAGELADWTILTSDNPRSEDPQHIIDEMAADMPDSSAVHSEVDRAQAIAMALAAAHRGDVVVIAGKGHEQEQELADRVVAFDDREVARRVLRGLRVGERQLSCAP
jgi:UDP-N-acetylmuramoyl-L-alanyl-D-glutamate--2,6-diaminopimelate ligase